MKLTQECRVSHRPEDVAEMLYLNIEAWDPGNYRNWVPENAGRSGKRFYGRMQQNHFKIIPLVPGKNFFTPVISGEIKKEAEFSALVSFRVCNSLWMNVVNAVLMAWVLLIVPLDVKQMLEAGAGQVWKSLAFVIGYGVIFAVFNIMNRICKKKYREKFLAFLRQGM